MLCENPDYNNSDFSETKIKKNKSYDTHITNQLLTSLFYYLSTHCWPINACTIVINLVVFDILPYKKLFFIHKNHDFMHI